MNRAQFMEQLEKLLSDIPYSERREALDYYESYFDDAGEENEAAVIRELGSPGKVAAIIKADLNENNDSCGEELQKGYHPKEKRSNGGMILILILLVFLSPFLTGAFGGVLGVLITILLLPFIIVFALGMGALGLLVGAAACAAVGLGTFAASPAAALLILGIAFILGALAIVFIVFLAWLAFRVLPVVLKKATDFLGRLLRRERKDGVDA